MRLVTADAGTGGETNVIAAPCHPNPNAASDVATLLGRGDIASLPQPLKDRLARLAARPHTYLPMQAFAEADGPSQLFQYVLLDTHGFQPNVFTTTFPGVNDKVMLTATGPTAGSRRWARCGWCSSRRKTPERCPKIRAHFIDIFTDINPMFVINNESGWYEGWRH